MDAVTTASLQDLTRRLRIAGDESSDLRCYLSHGLKFNFGDAEEEFGEAFATGFFRPIDGDPDWWNIGFYRKNVCTQMNRHSRRYQTGGNGNPETERERADSAALIQIKMRDLFDDAYWLANDIGLSRLPGAQVAGQLLPGHLTWLWLLYHAAWTCPKGTILRASKQYPSRMMTRIELREKQETAVGYDSEACGGFEAFQKAQEAIGERNKKMSKEERESEWMEIYDRNCLQAPEHIEKGEFLSILPIDPFTASAALLELMCQSDGTVDLSGLNETQLAAYKTLVQEGPMIGKNLAKKLNTSHDNLRKHVLPRLRPLGLKNDRNGQGYYIP